MKKKFTIGYWGYGHLIPNKIAADGCYNIRDSFIKSLVTIHQDEPGVKNEIMWLGNTRDSQDDVKDYPECTRQYVDIRPNDFIKLSKKFRNYTEKGKKTKQWYFNDVHQRRNLPCVDFVIVEINVMGLGRYDIMSLLEYYTNRNTKCFLWDMDAWGKGFVDIPKEYNVKEEFIYFLTPYQKEVYKRQIEFYYGYDSNKTIESAIKSEDTRFCYIGNDYHRGKKMIKFYRDLDCHIYGKWIKDKEKVVDMIGKDKFKGALVPFHVIPTVSHYYATIQVVRKEYEKLGLMTQRINEAANGRTICFIDSDIKDDSGLILKTLRVSSSHEASEKLDSFIKNNEVDDILDAQTDRLPTYKGQVNKILEVV